MLQLPFKKKFEGFTLIELLIIISIIAVLSVISMAIFTGIQKNVRDTKRKTDLMAMRKAVEIYHNINGRFPGAGTCTGDIPEGYSPWWNWSTCTGNDWDRAANDIALLLENSNLVLKMPVDPINDSTYNYLYEAWPDEPDATFYLCVNLENGSSAGFPGYGHNYCIKGGCITCH